MFPMDDAHNIAAALESLAKSAASIAADFHSWVASCSDKPELRDLTNRLAQSEASLSSAVASAGKAPTNVTEKENMAVKKVGDPTGNPTIDALISQVSASVAVDTSAVTLINGIAGEITAAVNAALAGGATAAQVAPLTTLATNLSASSASLSAAILANTPSAPVTP